MQVQKVVCAFGSLRGTDVAWTPFASLIIELQGLKYLAQGQINSGY